MVAKPIAVGVVGVLVLASALVLNYFVLPDEETATAVPAASPAPAATADRSATAATEPAATGTAPLTPAEPASPPVPSFDIVRVDPGGNAVIAGRGAPNTEIAVVDGDSELGRVTTDDRGEWVFVPPAMLPSGERILTLRETRENGSQSGEAVVLVIPEKGKDIAGRPSAQTSAPLAIVVPREEGGTAAARVLQAPAAGPLAQATPPAAAETPSAGSTGAENQASATVTTATPTAETPAPAGPIASPATADEATPGSQAAIPTPASPAAAGSTAPDAPAADARVAALPPQAAGGDTAAREATTAPDTAVAPDSSAPSTAAMPPAPGTAPALPMSAYPEARSATSEAAASSPSEVAVDVIDYDDKGEVVFSGRAEQGSRVEVFIDDRKVGDTQADAAGRWTMSPSEPVAPGAYQLRVDKLATTGTVEARVAFPFVRAAALTDIPGDRLVVIQPGNNLWRIATRVYGSGFRYVEIFDTNRDQIRDPDLIFPGQVFGLPRVN
jgi:nucleoid-associated protein YgaU